MPTDARDAFPDPPASTRRDWGASFTAQARPLGDRVVLYAGRRWDRMRDALRSVATGGIARRSDVVRELDAPQLGLRVTTWRGLELRGNWSRATRAPDFLELFGNQGSVLGNPTLAPERAENWDAGGAWSLDLGSIRASVEGAHYATRADDLIVYVRGSPSSVRAMNISRCRIRGEELTARVATPFGVTASCAGASQSTLDQGDVVSARGRRLPQRPEHLLSARLDVVRGPVRLTADVERIGENFLDRANRLRVPPRTLLGVSLSCEAHGARLTVEVKNLGDARASDVGGFPLPGRAVFASLDLRLGPLGAEQP
jgi:iron complex outermembrane receptor protein